MTALGEEGVPPGGISWENPSGGRRRKEEGWNVSSHLKHEQWRLP